MSEEKESARPPPEPWTETRPRPLWAPYDLPNSAIALIESEQLLQQLGVRDIVAGLGSASVTDFQNGIEKLKALLVTQFLEGVKQGEQNARDSAPVFSRDLGAGIAIGAAGASAVIGFAIWIVSQ